MPKKWFSLSLSLMVLCAWSAVPAWGAKPDDASIKAYILAHPEVLLEALSQRKEALFDLAFAGQAIKQRRAWRENMRQSLAHPLRPKIEPERPRMGNPQAPVLVVEYTNFVCTSCRKGAAVVSELLSKYPNRFQVLIKPVATDELSRQIALYFQAIALQNPVKAYRFYHQVFMNQPEVLKKGLPLVLKYVKSLNLNQARLSHDLADPKLLKWMEEDDAERKAFDLGGTPAFIAAGVPLRGPAPLGLFQDVWYISQGKQPPPLR